jgi:DNA-binding response OmpR family regulator
LAFSRTWETHAKKWGNLFLGLLHRRFDVAFNRLNMPHTLLLVDDNAVQAATRQAILTYSGHNVTVATNAGAALSLLEDPDLARKVRLVITDHVMPKVSGPQFVVQLRRRFPTLPILVLSGLPDAESEYVGMNIIYRLKPIAPEELIQLTQSLCEDPLGRTA